MPDAILVKALFIGGNDQVFPYHQIQFSPHSQIYKTPIPCICGSVHNVFTLNDAGELHMTWVIVAVVVVVAMAAWSGADDLKTGDY